MQSNSSINFYLIRHAESEANVESDANVDTRDLIGGHSINVRLTEKGIKQATSLGMQLKV